MDAEVQSPNIARRENGFDNKIISLYARGLTVRVNPRMSLFACLEKWGSISQALRESPRKTMEWEIWLALRAVCGSV